MILENMYVVYSRSLKGYLSHMNDYPEWMVWQHDIKLAIFYPTYELAKNGLLNTTPAECAEVQKIQISTIEDLCGETWLGQHERTK